MKKIILSLILLASVVSAQTPDPLALPLIQQAYYEYVGGCRVPDGTYGASNFGWSGGGDNAIGGGLAFDPKGNGGAGSLFISGNYRPRDGGFQGSVAEIALCDTWVNSPTPSSLSTAKVLQNFADVTAGGIANLEATMGGNQGYIKLAASALRATIFISRSSPIRQRACPEGQPRLAFTHLVVWSAGRLRYALQHEPAASHRRKVCERAERVAGVTWRLDVERHRKSVRH
jgi:hypothetical protein